jgi:hypothetical protein
VEENPRFLDAVSRLWDMARKDRDYFSQAVLQGVPEGNGVRYCRADLARLAPALRMRSLKQALEDLGPGQVRFDALARLERLLTSNRQGTIQFPGNKAAVVDKETVRLIVQDAGEAGPDA